MPRLMPNAQLMQFERLKRNMMILSSGYSGADMAKIMGVSTPTYYKRFKNPMELTKLEEFRLCKYFGISIGKFNDEDLKPWKE